MSKCDAHTYGRMEPQLRYYIPSATRLDVYKILNPI